MVVSVGYSKDKYPYLIDSLETFLRLKDRAIFPLKLKTVVGLGPSSLSLHFIVLANSPVLYNVRKGNFIHEAPLLLCLGQKVHIR